MDALSGLPRDIQREILSYNNIQDLIRCSATNKSWQTLIKEIENSIFNGFTAKLSEKIIDVLGGNEKISKLSKKLFTSAWGGSASITYGHYKNPNTGNYDPCIAFPAKQRFGDLVFPATVILHQDNNKLLLSFRKDCYDVTQNTDWLHGFISGTPFQTDSDAYIQLKSQIKDEIDSAKTKKTKKYSLPDALDKAIKSVYGRFSNERKK